MKSGRHNLFVVESPFQLMCATEARVRYCSGDNNHLFIIFRGAARISNRQQMEKLIDDGWTSANVHSYGRRKGLGRALRDIRVLSCAARLWPFERAFIGDVRKSLHRRAAFLARSRTVIDDGAASLRFLRELRARPRRIAKHGAPELFSIFATDDDAPFAQKNSLTYMRSVHSGAPHEDREFDLFLGGKLSEAGLISEEEELGLLRHFSSKNVGSRLLYAAHRDEAPEKLVRVRALGFEVVFPEWPIELMLLSEWGAPRRVFGYFSTALFTIRRIYPSASVQFIRVSLSKASVERKDEISRVYDELIREGVSEITADYA